MGYLTALKMRLLLGGTSPAIVVASLVGTPRRNGLPADGRN